MSRSEKGVTTLAQQAPARERRLESTDGVEESAGVILSSPEFSSRIRNNPYKFGKRLSGYGSRGRRICLWRRDPGDRSFRGQSEPGLLASDTPLPTSRARVNRD